MGNNTPSLGCFNVSPALSLQPLLTPQTLPSPSLQPSLLHQPPRPTTLALHSRASSSLPPPRWPQPSTRPFCSHHAALWLPLLFCNSDFITHLKVWTKPKCLRVTQEGLCIGAGRADPSSPISLPTHTLSSSYPRALLLHTPAPQQSECSLRSVFLLGRLPRPAPQPGSVPCVCVCSPSPSNAHTQLSLLVSLTASPPPPPPPPTSEHLEGRTSVCGFTVLSTQHRPDTQEMLSKR